MTSVVPALLALPAITAHLTPAEVTAIKAATGGLASATSALANVSTIQAGASYVQTIETCLNVIVGVAATVPAIPEPYHTSLVVATLALPPVETLVGLAVQQGTALYATIQAKKVTPASVAVPVVPSTAGPQAGAAS